MIKSFSADRPTRLWIELQEIVAQRAARETQIATQCSQEKRQTEEQYQSARKQATRDYDDEKTRLENQYVSDRGAINERCRSAHAKLEGEYRRVRSNAKTAYKRTKLEETQRFNEARWEANTVYEATKDGPPQRLKAFEDQMAASRGSLAGLGAGAEQLLARRWQKLAPQQPEPSPWPADVVPVERYKALATEAKGHWEELLGQRVPRLFESGHLYLLAPLFCALAAVPAGLVAGWARWQIWVPVGVVVGLILWGGLVFWLHRVARRQTLAVHALLRHALVDAEQAADRALTDARDVCRRETEAIAERLRTDLEKADTRFNTAVEKSREARDETIRRAAEHYPPRLTELVVARERELVELEAAHARQMEEFERRYEEETRRRDEDYAAAVRDREERHRQAWDEMARRWHEGMTRLAAEVDELNETTRSLFFDWYGRDVGEWTPTGQVPAAVPFGRVTLQMGQLDGGIPADERLRTERTEFTVPALLPFPHRSLLIKTAGEGRDQAVETIRAVMLRMLTGIRPGKVRFTVMDPVGLGESFSAFMHLADFDEQAITSRIWTESSHIEQQLVKLTEHMETVIQVYLRNEFETIQQYNEFAGEMAEPYRVLVVANFPANFSETAARRLLSIISSGARCGVYVLLSVDTRLKLPHDFNMADLERDMLELVWREGQFVWKGSPLARLPLALDTPPESKPFTDLVRSVGRQIEEIDRVEVPFEFIVPKEGQWWSGDTARELDVPLGRAGAMKLQHLNLGRGMAQHVLIAGKTGSGKSNLLHAIITNVALWYAPEQVQIYLVDFKKGVEFKPYAEMRLPHARVVAIESEREFGLSVLERLDAELKDRGDRFRRVGVQDMAGWRRTCPDEPMPRVLLVIDEFQELFVEDDRIGQTAALLLDRLVRQGRAFGMHVLLGSQTLAGAYSLPRATIGQMAVRIALQCSESDAHLILSEDNTAARLLTRPGEAIYNDANGLFEGNHPFQIVFLPDHEKSEYLRRLREFTESRAVAMPPPIVFEGNAAANPRENWLLEEALAGNGQTNPTAPGRAWLGSAVAIKDPTSVLFRRQGGSNLLLVGHDEEAAIGILTTAMISLAAQMPPVNGAAGAPPAFYVLDGTRPEAPEADVWKRFCRTFPREVYLGGTREMVEAIARIDAECTRRHDEHIDDAPPMYLVIFNLGRFRELRREEETFRFSSRDEEEAPKPANQLAHILREGPSLGIHTLLWCDTCNTLNRWLDRQTVHDLEMRVAFQMSASDSSTLIDSADAGRLGPHRAIFYDEGLGQMEKFRPYRVPDEAWLAEIRTRLAAKPAQSEPRP